MRYELGGLDIMDLGDDADVGFAQDYDDGTGLGISVGGIFRGIKKGVRVVTAPARFAAKGVVKGAKFVAKRPYLLAAPLAVGLQAAGVPVLPAALALAKGAAKGGAKIATAPVKLAGRLLRGRRPPSQAEQAAQARVQIEADTRKRAEEGRRLVRERARELGKRPAVSPKLLAEIVEEPGATREQKRAGVADLLKRVAGEVLGPKDATGETVPPDVSTTPLVQTARGAGPAYGGGDTAPGAADELPQAPPMTLAGLMQGPMPLVLGGLAAWMLFGGQGGSGRRRRR